MVQTVKRKIKTVINNPKSVPIKVLRKLSPLMGDEVYLRLLFPLMMGYKLDLDNPKTYSEKIQWLKLNNRESIYTNLVDKHEVKRYVSNLIGEKYVIPTLGVWNSFEEIDFDKLPNQFVLKTTHDQGGVVICKDKSHFNIDYARSVINKHLKVKHFYLTREWTYKNVKPRIIAEKYIEDVGGDDVKDYKFHCFNGEPKLLYIADGRNKDDLKFTYYDMEFQKLDITQYVDQSDVEFTKPYNFELMKQLASKLSENIPYVRVDFYNIEGSILFGEYTFYPGGGLIPFEPIDWDYTLGNWIDLESIKNR